MPGRLLAGEHPGGATASATRARLRRLLQAGVSTFVDLTEPDELAPYDAELPVSVVYLRFPVPDHGIPAEPSRMAEILDCLGAALRAGRTIYLHCRAGIGRTGMVAGCVLLEQGRSGDAALAELNRLWQHSPRRPERRYGSSAVPRSRRARRRGRPHDLPGTGRSRRLPSAGRGARGRAPRRAQGRYPRAGSDGPRCCSAPGSIRRPACEHRAGCARCGLGQLRPTAGIFAMRCSSPRTSVGTATLSPPRAERSRVRTTLQAQSQLPGATA